MRQRNTRPDSQSRPGNRTQSRSRTPELAITATEADPPFEHAVTNLRSKLQNLEEKYSYFMKHYATQLQEHRVRKGNADERKLGTEERVRQRPRDTSPKPSSKPSDQSPDNCQAISALIEETKSRLLSCLPESLRSQVTEELSALSAAVREALQKIRWKSEPGQAKEWVRKLLKLEEEKRELETKHRDYIETLTKRMMARNDEYQREIAMLQRENALLVAGSHSSKRSVISASPKSHIATRSMTPDIESVKPLSVDGRQRFITPDKRDGSPIQRSVSPAERKIQGLKNELEGYKQKLDLAGFEIDTLKAWKNSYTKNPPDYAEIVHAHSSETAHERKQLLTKIMILHHKLNSVYHGVTKFVRCASALTKSSRDREAIAAFENARSDLESLIKDSQKEENLPAIDTALSQSDREELSQLREDLAAERQKSDTFEEMFGLIQSQIEAFGGANTSPAVFIEQQNALILQLREQVKNTSEDTVEALRKENRLLVDKQMVEKMTIKRLSEELEEARARKPLNEDFVKRQVTTLAGVWTQQADALVKVIVERIAAKSARIDTLAERVECFRTCANLSDSPAALRSTLESQAREIKALQTRLEAANKSHFSALSSKDAEIKELIEEIKAGEVDNKALRLELAETAQSEGRLRESLEQKIRSLTESGKREATAEVEREKQRKEAALKAVSAERDQLLSEVKSLQGRLQSSVPRSDYTAVLSEHNALKAVSQSLEEELRSAKLTLQGVQKGDQQRSDAVDSLKNELKEKQMLVDSLRSALDEEIRNYEQKMERAKSEFAISMTEMERKHSVLRRENAALQESVSSLEGDVTALRRVSEQYESEKNRLEASLARSEARLSQALSRESVLKETNTHLSLESGRLAAEKSELQGQLQSLLADLKTAERNAEKVSVIDTLQMQMNAQAEEIRRLHGREEDAIKDRERLETALTDAQVRAACSERQLAAREKALRRTKSALGDYREGLNSVREVAKMMASEGGKYAAELQHKAQLYFLAARKENEELKCSHETAVRKLAGEKAALESNFADYKKQVEETAKRDRACIEKLQQETEELRRDYESKHSKLLSQCSQSENEVSKYKAQVAVLDRQIKDAQEVIEELEASLAAERATVTSLSEQLQAKDSTLSTHSDSLTQAQRATASLQSALSAETAQREKIAQQLASLKDTNARQAREKQQVIEDLESRWQTATAAAEGLKREVAELAGKVQRAAKEKEEVAVLLQRANEDLSEQQSQVAVWRNDARQKDEAISRLSADLAKERATAKEASAKVEQLSAECFEAIEQRLAAEERSKALSAQLQSATQDKDREALRAAQLSQSVAALEESVQKVNREKAELESAHQALLTSSSESSRKTLETEVAVNKAMETSAKVVEEQQQRIARLQDDVENYKLALNNSKSDNGKLQVQLQSAQDQVASLSAGVGSLQSQLQAETEKLRSSLSRVSELEREAAELREELRKLTSEQAFHLTSYSDRDSVHIEVAQEVEVAAGQSEEIFSESRIDTEEPELRAANPEEDTPRRTAEETVKELVEMLEGYVAAKEDVVDTVRQLLEELSLLKKSRIGVVIPKLQIPSQHPSQYSQTSPKSALSLSFAPDSQQSEDRPVGETPERASKSANVSAIQDQDTPKSKAFPELWRSRASSEMKQHKTEEIYSLHNRIKGLEKDLDEESKIRAHWERQTRLLKEEIEEKNRALKRAAVAESAGEKSPVNVEHLKDLIMKLLMLLPEL